MSPSRHQQTPGLSFLTTRRHSPLLAQVDTDYCFTVTDVVSYGSSNDGGIFGNSALGKALVPSPWELPSAPDQGKVNLSGKALPEDQRIFNYGLSRASHS